MCVLGSLAPVVRLWWKIILFASCGYPTPSISTMHTHMHPGFCYNQLAPTKIPLNFPSFGTRFQYIFGGNIWRAGIKDFEETFTGLLWIVDIKRNPFPAVARQTHKHSDKSNACPDHGFISLQNTKVLQFNKNIWFRLIYGCLISELTLWSWEAV